MHRVRLNLMGWLFCLAMAPRALWSDTTAELPLPEAVTPQLYATGFEFAEGPTLDPDGNLYVVNYRGNGNIGRIQPDGTASVLCTLDELLPVEDRKSRGNGLKIDSEGRLIVADSTAGRLLRISADGRNGEVLAERWEGVRFNSINDVALDLEGNIYFSDPGGSGRENPIGSVYRYDINTKKVSRLVTGLAFPNGIAVTPDQEHLCVGESQNYRILIYRIGEDGSVGEGRVLVKFPDRDEGGILGGKFEPDGMVFDTQGRLYVAMWDGGVINVVDLAEGKIVRQYGAGGARVTNCHFHGPFLYTTVASKEAVFRLRLGVYGFAYAGR
jgi:gluconolactonase